MVSNEEILDALRDVDDPELDWNIVDLGLVYRAESVDGGIEVDFTLTYPGCPAEAYIRGEIASCLKRFFGVESRIRTVWSPLWGPERMSEGARVSLGYPI
jgi:metal-sulfur cluster biosynthetic enzyme